jgi:hypothetical protein
LFFLFLLTWSLIPEFCVNSHSIKLTIIKEPGHRKLKQYRDVVDEFLLQFVSKHTLKFKISINYSTHYLNIFIHRSFWYDQLHQVKCTFLLIFDWGLFWFLILTFLLVYWTILAPVTWSDFIRYFSLARQIQRNFHFISIF